MHLASKQVVLVLFVKGSLQQYLLQPQAGCPRVQGDACIMGPTPQQQHISAPAIMWSQNNHTSYKCGLNMLAGT
jgi:hypothetical protein